MSCEDPPGDVHASNKRPTSSNRPIRWDRIAELTSDDAEAISRLLWPEIVEYRGCSLLAELFRATTADNWLSKLRGDVRAVERVMNHVHLDDTIGSVSVSARDEFAAVLCATWRCRLAEWGAGKFDVLLTSDPGAEGTTITFCKSECDRTCM